MRGRAQAFVAGVQFDPGGGAAHQPEIADRIVTESDLDPVLQPPSFLRIVGYSDRLAARPGEAVAFKVSCEDGAGTFRADMVRLRCGDDRPDGPGFSEHPVQAAVDGDYPGRRQAVDVGSFVVVPASPLFDAVGDITIAALVWPTLPGTGEQTVAGRWVGPAAAGAGFALTIDEAARPCLRLGDGSRVWRLSAGHALAPRRWVRLLASLSVATGEATLRCEPVEVGFGPPSEQCAAMAPMLPRCPAGAPFLIAAHLAAPRLPRRHTAGHFNGKIEAPALWAGVVPADRVAEALKAPRAVPASLVAAWDFARGISGVDVADRGPHGLDGRCINRPTRGVTGHTWSGESLHWRERPEEYAAIHFHEDDLGDCAWETDFSWAIPDDLPSGVYAARLATGPDGEDHVPFFVLPPRGAARHRVAFLASTATYIAYGNSHDAYENPIGERAKGGLPVIADTDRFLMTRRDFGLSTYDLHRDGSGVAHSSRLRPLLQMRPKRALYNFNSDLHVTDWLEAVGEGFDVIDDETLHHEGLGLLSPYRCVVTGTHPEYHSAPMLRALAEYTRSGGRLMYLGGNGFYWRVAWDPAGGIEVRRGETGTRTWTGQPGEAHLSLTGEPGGLWRSSGRAPQRLVGVGYVAEGFDVGSYYLRTADSADPRVAFIFDGVGDEKIGDFGAFGGAAALELDAVDPALGTPPHALRVAASTGHGNVYLLTNEELPSNYPGVDGIENAKVRADMVFFEMPGGGAVFSTGSIGWAASLAHGGYDNSVARITGNVLRRFTDPTAFQMPD